MALRTPPLHAIHDELGASFTDFGGWDMPVEFDSIRDEHDAVRTAAGIFDVSHMSEIEVTGPDAEELMQRLTSNDVAELEPGAVQYSTITNEDGMILDDAFVYRMPEELPEGTPGTGADYLFVPNAGHDAEMHERWTAHREQWDLDADVENRTDDYGMLAVQGPDAEDLVAAATEESVRDVSRFTGTALSIGDAPCYIARTGYTGEDGYEIIFPWDDAETVWTAFDCQPVGLGARDTLRLEMGYLLSGQDFNPDEDPRTPLEAGVAFVVDLETDFVGRDALVAQQEAGLEQQFVGMVLQERGVPRHGYPITDEDGTEIGTVTSGTMSPSLGEPIALGYVDSEYTEDGTTVHVEIRDEPKKASITRPPFLEGYQ